MKASRARPLPVRASIAFAFFLVVALALWTPSDRARANPCTAIACGNSITVLDGAAEYMSIALDAADRPVVSYGVPGANQALRVLRCANATCGGGSEAVTVDAAGLFTSLELDVGGDPVVSYYYPPAGDLRVVHCNDPACVGGDEVIATPDTAGDVGRYSSLELDAEGRPVVSYSDSTNGDLKVLHCGDANCQTGNSIVTADSPGAVGQYSSLQLDEAGNPVVAYQDELALDVKLLHCNDPNCSGGGESITTPDSEFDVGYYISLKLDSAGRPVVSYRDQTHFDLRLLRCGDANCTSDNIAVSADTGGFVGSYGSLALDEQDRPVMAHWDASQGRLKVLYCGDQTCTANSTVSAPDDVLDSSAPVGQFASIAIDEDGKPAVAYARSTGVGLGILRCGNADCGAADTDGDGCQDAQESMNTNGTELGGGQRDAKNPWDYFNPSGDGHNRIDDVMLVLDKYYEYAFLAPPSPPNTPNGDYTAETDRTIVGPNPWNLGSPNGRQNVDDVIAIVSSFMHDCF